MRGFRFLVEIDDHERWLRVKGLSREVKYESFREGGVNEYEHKLVAQVIYPVVVLERGLALDDL
jgi:phage tail-like protein